MGGIGSVAGPRDDAGQCDRTRSGSSDPGGSDRQLPQAQAAVARWHQTVAEDAEALAQSLSHASRVMISFRKTPPLRTTSPIPVEALSRSQTDATRSIIVVWNRRAIERGRAAPE